MEQPLVSIIMSNYNSESFIRKTIESVLNQTYDNFEFIIIDDASTDSSRKIIDSFSDSRISRYYFEQNEHMCYAFNYAISMARGEYLARIDSDDIWELTKLEKQIKYMSSNLECGACFSLVTVVDEEENVLSSKQTDRVALFETQNRNQAEWIRQFYFNGSCLCHPSVIMRRKVLEKVGVYNYSLVQIQDYDLWVRIVKNYPIHIIQEKLVKYRWFLSGKNASAPSETTRNRSNFEFTYVLSKYFDDMSDDILIQSFGNDFVRKGTTDHIELLCEKVFLLLMPVFCGNTHKIGGMVKLVELLQNDVTRNILREKYGVTQKNFYELSASPLYLDLEMQSQLLNNGNNKSSKIKIFLWKIIPRPIWNFLRRYK